MKINSFKFIDNDILHKQDISSKNDNKLEFDDYLKTSIDNLNEIQIKADNYRQLLATGQVENMHEVMIAAEKANIALQFTLAIRNKVIDAYKEIMRMQI